MGRALSLSCAAHAAIILSFLLLSATRQPLVVPQIIRPVRLVTYLEPAAAPRKPAAVVTDQAQARPSPASSAALTAEKVSAADPSPATPALMLPEPVVVPRLAIPSPGNTPPTTRAATARRGAPTAVAPSPVAPPAVASPAEPRPALGERLTRKLAAVAPPESRPEDLATPQIAALPPPEATRAAQVSDPLVPEAPAQSPGTVEPLGYFPHAWYLAVLKEKIFARWSPPSEFFQSSRPPVALISFSIDRAGVLARVAIKESSGSSRFDQSALAAVKGLNRVPALPEQYHEESLDVVIRFQDQR